jgi:Phage Tail Collar Domain
MVVALLALLIACSGAAFAAIPSSSGTITTCYDKGNGTLRVIDPDAGQACHSTETQLSWKDGIHGKVAESDKLDGLDSSEFARADLFGNAINARLNDSDVSRDECVMGEVELYAGNKLPYGWRKAHGQVWPIHGDSKTMQLFTLLGTDYGGNGSTTFALPDLRGAEPNGEGKAAPNYAICTHGIYP